MPMRLPVIAGLIVGALLCGTQVAVAGAAPVKVGQPAASRPLAANNLHREVFGFALADDVEPVPIENF